MPFAIVSASHIGVTYRRLDVAMERATRLEDFADPADAFYHFGRLAGGDGPAETPPPPSRAVPSPAAQSKRKATVASIDVEGDGDAREPPRDCDSGGASNPDELCPPTGLAEAPADDVARASAASKRTFADRLAAARRAFDSSNLSDEEYVEKLPDEASFLVWDTETTGLGRQATIVQLAWTICDASGAALRTYNRLWRLPPKGYIEKMAYETHRISKADTVRRGFPTVAELRRFVRVIRTLCERGIPVVAHNASFDLRMLHQTASRHGAPALRDFIPPREALFCTQTAAAPLCGMRGKGGRRKVPSNVELYRFLLHKDPEGRLHDALTDVRVTAKSYVAGRKRRWW